MTDTKDNDTSEKANKTNLAALEEKLKEVNKQPGNAQIPANVLGLVGSQASSIRKWTKDEDEQLRVYLRDTHNIEELSQKMKISEADLWQRMEDLAWSRRRYKELREALIR